MKEKIMNVKNILRIIISLFVIFSMVKSCAKAITYEDIKEYVNLTADYFPNNSNYQNIKSVINAMNTAEQNNVNTMGNGYENVAIYLQRQSSRTYINIKVFQCNSLKIDIQGVTYTGNYKTMQWQNSWSSIYGPYNETNYSIDGGWSYRNTTGQENNLQGMTYLGQTPTSRYTIPSNICRKPSNTTIYISRI